MKGGLIRGVLRGGFVQMMGVGPVAESFVNGGSGVLLQMFVGDGGLGLNAVHKVEFHEDRDYE